MDIKSKIGLYASLAGLGLVAFGAINFKYHMSWEYELRRDLSAAKQELREGNAKYHQAINIYNDANDIRLREGVLETPETKRANILIEDTKADLTKAEDKIKNLENRINWHTKKALFNVLD